MRRSVVMGLVLSLSVVGTTGALAEQAADDAAPDAGGALAPASIAVHSPPGAPIVTGHDAGVLLILDTSGSMRTKSKATGVPRIEAAKKALRKLVNKGLADGANVGIRVYDGSKETPCLTNLLVHPGPLDRKAAVAQVKEIWPGKGGRSPIAGSILMVADDLDGYGKKNVVLISDGDDTCDGDPAQMIEMLRSAGIEFQLDIVGFDIKDKSVKQKMRSWTEMTGGSYVDISDADQLLAALKQAIRAEFVVTSLDDPGVDYGGIVGGSPIEVPPGNYVIQVAGESLFESEPVELGPGDQHVEQLPA